MMTFWGWAKVTSPEWVHKQCSDRAAFRFTWEGQNNFQGFDEAQKKRLGIKKNIRAEVKMRGLECYEIAVEDIPCECPRRYGRVDKALSLLSQSNTMLDILVIGFFLLSSYSHALKPCSGFIALICQVLRKVPSNSLWPFGHSAISLV